MSAFFALAYVMLGVAIGVTAMAVLVISREPAEPKVYSYNESNEPTMDEADRASQEVERSVQEAIRARRPTGPVATGRCLWCDEIVGDGIRWCPDEDCRDRWEKQRRLGQ